MRNRPGASIRPRMRILFYLPVVTPWWFEHIVEPLIRKLAPAAEIYILAPAMWSGTGIGPDQMQRCADLPDLRWCIVDDPEHPTMRTRPSARQDLVDFARGIDPDHVVCRSADLDTVRDFPGRVRFLMEAGAAPFPLPPQWVAFQDQPLDQGLIPTLDADDRAALDHWIAPAWTRLRALQDEAGSRDRLLALFGSPSDRPTLLLPLEYEHEENFFLMHRVGATPNHRLVSELAERIGPDFNLCVTNHPLNTLHVDNKRLETTVSGLGESVALAPAGEGASTVALGRHCDGILVGDSKAFALAAFFGKPMVRRSRFATGEWLGAYSEIDAFLADIAAGQPRVAAESDARIWAAFHLLNQAFDPQDPSLAADDVLGRMDRAFDRGRWPAAMARIEALAPELFA
ncbi:MAG: hypothetical protein JWO25_8 [Alphaproteobacteria bacterium]|nr:hypothetical protein [Alphaproteobacteria bacterium]